MEFYLRDRPGLLAIIGKGFCRSFLFRYMAQGSPLLESDEDFFVLTDNENNALNQNEVEVVKG